MTDLSKIPVPSQHHIDQARQELEHLQMKLGKVEPRAILSAAQARADDFELKEVRAKCDEAREKYRALVDRFTNVDRIAEATSAIRARLQPHAVDSAAPSATKTSVSKAPADQVTQPSDETSNWLQQRRQANNLLHGIEIDPASAAQAEADDPLILLGPEPDEANKG